MASGENTISIPLRNAWRFRWSALGKQDPASRVLSGSLIMLLGSTMVAGLNFAFNIVMARLLGPALFSQAAAMVTLLMLISCISLSFQLVCAKFVARNETAKAKSFVYSGMRTQAWLVGLAVGVVLALGSFPISTYLRMPNVWLLIVLAVGMAFYIPLGAKRGNLQGQCNFGALSRNYILEAASKLAIAIVLVELGYGVMGAVGAISASIFAAVVIAGKGSKAQGECGVVVPASFREGMQAIVFFVGQVVINNIDIILVKHFFTSEQAGIYAAIALVGRVLYFAAWSIVSAMFPISAAAKEEEHNRKHVLLLPLLIVLVLAAVFILILALFPGVIIHIIFGEGFRSTWADPLLSLYAVATGLYALSVVLMTYEMSRKIANTGWLQLLFSGALVFLIYLFHSNLRQVIVVQIVLMAAMLLIVSLPFLRSIQSLRWKEVA